MMFRTASGWEAAHEGIRTVERSTEYRFTRRLTIDTSAEDLIDCVTTCRDRSSSAVRQDRMMHCECTKRLHSHFVVERREGRQKHKPEC